VGYPFPLASGRYEVGPTMRRFGQAGGGFPAEQGHFKPDGELLETLLAKLAVLRQGAHEAHLVDPELTPAAEADLLAALRASFELIAAEHPAMIAVDEQGVTLRHLGLRLEGWGAPQLRRQGGGWPHLWAASVEAEAWFQGRQGLWLLGDGLALSAQEDLAIVRGPESDGVNDVFEWLHVCLPSNWAPGEKIGRSFVTAHLPVVHAERLLASAPQIVRAMIQAGPFVRYVWGIHRDGAFCHNPRLHRQPDWQGETGAELVSQAYLRLERQTTYGLPALNRSLFTIRYWTVPLGDVILDPWKRERLATALAGMDAEELDYKGLALVRDRLVAFLSEQE
jgi:hypothetical protein